MKKIVKVVVIALAISLMLIAIKNEYARVLMQDASYGMPAVIAEDREYRDDTLDQGVTLFIGSSMFRQGLDIYGLEQELDGRNYILSYNGNDPALEYLELEYLIDNDVRIAHVYMDMYTGSMLKSPWVSDELIFLQTDTSFKFKVWNNIKADAGFSDFWEMFISSGNDLLLSWPVYNTVASSVFYRGGNISQTASVNGEFQDNIARDNNKYEVTSYEHLEPSDEFNDEQINYIRKIIQLCRDNDIELTFIETPKYISYGISSEYMARIYKFALILEQEKTEYYLSDVSNKAMPVDSELKYIKGIVEFDNSNAENFIDPIHLSPSGRIAYTKELADVLN